ncbi:hypothetical protein Ahy_B04g072577 isoform D [Arachis hypogaea]|uniref:UBC core domain-containing protein n=1 Tax=Arachis hypogaea TaxID=3818 RepID=A0A444ZNG5_ARAHY|nr:hypothetical protein Ahy_B04g072577 isoform D [Arachis hypogaea]
MWFALEPVSHVVACPSPNDILEWHYVLEGIEGKPFAGGYYHGKIKFLPDYPFKLPGISIKSTSTELSILFQFYFCGLLLLLQFVLKDGILCVGYHVKHSKKCPRELNQESEILSPKDLGSRSSGASNSTA